MKSLFKDKKIGIWGFGVVGKSAYNYVQQWTDHITIMDKTALKIPNSLQESPQNIQQFLQDNDFIIASPGIALHSYKKYQHKFISELDILQTEYHLPTIAITGTAGKTSITYLLQQCVPNSIAAGNIGFAMLNMLTEKTKKTAILELSSFQLQQSKTFAPDLALIINFYPNHLDQHKNEKEYLQAKCNILKHQTKNQIALLPCSLIEKINKQITIRSTIYTLCDKKCLQHNYPTFSYDNSQVFLTDNQEKTIIFDKVYKLNPITYQQNWFMVVIMLYLAKIDIKNLVEKSYQILPQEHRLEKFATYNLSSDIASSPTPPVLRSLGTEEIRDLSLTCNFYNDSKSTVWQTTHMALELFKDKKIALFFGGLSKGTDRSALFKYIKNKPIEIYIFGAEAKQIQNMCKESSITCFVNTTLDQSIETYKQHIQKYDIVLLSPGGTSFDLYNNYKERGNHFKTLIKKALMQST